MLPAGPRVPTSRNLLVASALWATAGLAAAAEPRLVVAFDDPPGDATGPGTYTPPGDADFQDGDFDLRRFAVYDEGDHVRFEVTLGAAIRTPDATRRTNAIPLDLTNGIYLQNVDIYVDSDPRPGSGFSVCIPGRRVAFADGRTWETAVVLTPQPGVARAIVTDVLGPAAAHVLFPGPLEIRGGTIVARVPTAALGGTPRRDWGWSVHVSGARWERGDALSARLDALTMPVLGVREARAFGGAPSGDVHPRVVDVLLPPGLDQKAVLGSFDAATRAYARVPFVYADVPPGAATAPQAQAPAPPFQAPAAQALPAAPRPGPLPPIPPSLAPRLGSAPELPAPGPPQPSLAPSSPAAAPAGGGPVLTVADISEDVVTLAGANIGLVPLQIGRVVDRNGATMGLVVVDRLLENGVVAHIVSGREHVRWGARVRFDAQPSKR